MKRKPSKPDLLRAEAEARANLELLAVVEPCAADEVLHELRVHQIELEMQNESLRQAQIVLEESRDRFSDFYDFAPIGYIAITAHALIAEINLTGALLLGADRRELLKRRFAPFVAPEYRDAWHRYFMYVRQHDFKQAYEFEILRKDGSRLPVRFDSMRLGKVDSAGNVLFTLTDIAEQKLAEAAMREREAFNVAILDTIPAEVAVLDSDGIIVAVNQSWRRFRLNNNTAFWKPAPDSDIGIRYFAACHDRLDEGASQEAREGILYVLERRLTSFSLEYRCHSLATPRWFVMNVAPLDGNDRRVVVTHTDITAQKLLKTPARALAHVVQENPAGVAGANPDYAIDDASETFARATGYRGDQLFGGTPKTLNIAPIVKEMAALLRFSEPSLISIKTELADRLPEVSINPLQLRKLLLALCVQARDAMAAPGTITIGLEPVVLEKAQACDSCHCDFSGAYLMISAVDTGSEMPGQNTTGNFDPFFAKKAATLRAESGSSLWHNIVHCADGHIAIVAAPGKGTAFCAYLPAKTRETGHG